MKLSSLFLSLLSSELAQQMLLLLELLLAFFGFFVIGIDEDVTFGVVFVYSIKLASD